MKVKITEEQFKQIILEGYNPKFNHKPSEEFDKIYGTKLSLKYDFSPYTEEEVWERWLLFRDEGIKEPFIETLKILRGAFPFVDINKLDLNTRKDIMLGMVSGFNQEDIIFFSIYKVPYVRNFEQKDLESKLPPEVVDNIQWVLSPNTIEIIKNKFNAY